MCCFSNWLWQTKSTRYNNIVPCSWESDVPTKFLNYYHFNKKYIFPSNIHYLGRLVEWVVAFCQSAWEQPRLHPWHHTSPKHKWGPLMAALHKWSGNAITHNSVPSYFSLTHTAWICITAGSMLCWACVSWNHPAPRVSSSQWQNEIQDRLNLIPKNKTHWFYSGHKHCLVNQKTFTNKASSSFQLPTKCEI